MRSTPLFFWGANMKKEQLERIRNKLGEVRTIIQEDTENAGPIIASFDHLYAVVTSGIKDILWAVYEGENKPPETPVPPP